ncbi:MAG: acetyl-CoA carboxylase, biotin carboxyl carrier protein [Pedosphaera sp.]|nr:acetyl-CoA carboxylase, biotin carboxyl carrier protein [Pedosphaera sp.]
MKKNSISEFELERQDFKIKLKRAGGGVVSSAQFEEPQLVAYSGSQAIPSLANPGPSAVSIPVNTDMEIKSPMIGTFYRAPSPEAGNYVEIGTEVGPETVVCIIEAMKVMNEIKAEARGIITQVTVENAKPVEYGQPLFKIRPI